METMIVTPQAEMTMKQKPRYFNDSIMAGDSPQLFWKVQFMALS